MASASARVRVSATVVVTPGPCPSSLPGVIKIRLEPMPWISSVMAAWVPSPRARRAITAPTPMTMPNMVRLERSLLAASP